MSAITFDMLWDRASIARRGIHARTLLPSPTYDHAFELRRDQAGQLLCVMRPGVAGYDKHYWEEVPAP